MVEFDESGLKFIFPESYNPYKVDAISYDGLSAVDFAAETLGERLFLEVKNLDNPKVPTQYIDNEKNRFFIKTEKYKCRGCLKHTKCPKCDRIEFVCEISTKFKDTILKEMAMGKVSTKPITCILLLVFKDFDYQQRRILYQNIRERLPRFREDEFCGIENIQFELLDINQFSKMYCEIKVIAQACE